MFLPRTESGDCPAGHVSCTISIVNNPDNVPGSVSPDDTTPSDTNYLDRPGAHRFIGIGMVVAMALIVVVLWMLYARYPRRQFASICGRRSDHDADGDGAVDLEKGERVLGGDDYDEDTKAMDSLVDGAAAKPKRLPTTKSEKGKARNMKLQSEPRGVIKEVSGGVVTFTEVPRPVRSKDRYPQPALNSNWEFEHVHGVRFEARSSNRHLDRKPPNS